MLAQYPGASVVGNCQMGLRNNSITRVANSDRLKIQEAKRPGNDLWGLSRREPLSIAITFPSNPPLGTGASLPLTLSPRSDH